MFKPGLNELSRTQEIISSFGGYNHNPVINENEFYHTENMSSCEYPMLTPRNKRAYFNVSGDRLHGIFSKSKIAYINNGQLYYGGEPVTGLLFEDIEEQRQFVSMGAYLLVFPDKMYLNTADLSDYGNLENFYRCPAEANVTVSLCKGDNSLYEGYAISSAEPENPENGTLWLDTSLSPNVLKQYSKSIGMWVEIAVTYVRIASSGIGKGFSAGDGVEIEGFTDESLNGSHIIRSCGDDYITVTGIIKNTITGKFPVRVSRVLPEMDFVCENGNRIWGCNSENNEIYASKLGDPKNFRCYTGVSTDSYAVTVGTDGAFTGCISYRGYVLFFKENCVHKIYGQNPPYTVTTSYIRGVLKGSEKSLVCLNETLYYKSPNGICSYEGGVPVDIFTPVCKDYYTNAVAGALGDRYYICMSDKQGERVLFCYDESGNIWHRQDNIDITDFATHNSNLYFIGVIDGIKRLCLMDGVNKYGNFSGELDGFYTEDDFPWSAETGLWGLGLPENKYYSGITVRFEGDKSAEFSVDFQVNCSGVWENQLSITLDKTGSVTLPFITPRCDTLSIRIRGKGRIRIFSISRKIERGSELNV